MSRDLAWVDRAGSATSGASSSESLVGAIEEASWVRPTATVALVLVRACAATERTSGLNWSGEISSESGSATQDFRGGPL